MSTGRNIQFNYLYRDAGNYKVFGFVVFSNPEQHPLSWVDKEIQKNLIDGMYFNPDEVGIPRLQHDKWNSNLDHDWNEFEGLTLTNEKSTMDQTILNFIERLTSCHKWQ